jgi:hypothetical protein
MARMRPTACIARPKGAIYICIYMQRNPPSRGKIEIHLTEATHNTQLKEWPNYYLTILCRLQLAASVCVHSLSPLWIVGKFSISCIFPCENKLILVKFMYNSYKIPTLQRGA